jgi:hypothetical protein
MRGEAEEAHQANQEKDEAKSDRKVFPSFSWISGPHWAQPTVIGPQRIDNHRRKLAHDVLRFPPIQHYLIPYQALPGQRPLATVKAFFEA